MSPETLHQSSTEIFGDSWPPPPGLRPLCPGGDPEDDEDSGGEERGGGGEGGEEREQDQTHKSG